MSMNTVSWNAITPRRLPGLHGLRVDGATHLPAAVVAAELEHLETDRRWPQARPSLARVTAAEQEEL
jgi:hypothetical protein